MMSRVTLVEVTMRNVFPVEIMIAEPAASSTAPIRTGNCSKPMRRMISSAIARLMLPSARKKRGSSAYIAKPTNAIDNIRTSTITTPMNMPITARRALAAVSADENFWYMLLSLMSSRNVGNAMPMTQKKSCPPITSK